MAFKKEKEAAEKQKLQELQEAIVNNSDNQVIDSMKLANLSEETIQNVQQKLQEDARSKVAEIQGTYYDTCD